MTNYPFEEIEQKEVKKMINNPSLMEDEFHDWLEQCPNSWVRLAVDDDSSTYKFYRKDDND